MAGNRPRLNASPLPAVKLQVLERLSRGLMVPGTSKNSLVKKLCKEVGWKSSNSLTKAVKMKEKLQEAVKKRGLAGQRPPGSRLAWTRLTAAGRPNKGLRLPGERGYLGKTDRLRELKDKTKAWAQLELSRGHVLTRRLLMAHYKAELNRLLRTGRHLKATGVLNEEDSVDLF